MIEVAFDMLDDPEERAYFHELPTSFKLDDEAVDRLIAAGRKMLQESPELGALLERLNRRAPLASPSD
jgi:NTE family protein